MGKIIIASNMSLDGVVQDPSGEEGYSFGGWFMQVTDNDREAWTKVELDQALGASAILLGRRSDAWFAPKWLARTGLFADTLNGLPKYVISSTVDAVAWGNGKVLRGDVVDEVAKLKQDVHGEILVIGSYQLVHTLIEHDLADELRIMIYPFVLGGGGRMFGDTTNRKHLRLVDTRTVGDSLAYVTYEIGRQRLS
jgi:dihydrofolate reductase